MARALATLRKKPTMAAYDRIISAFHPTHAVVLIQSADHTPWSARPGLYDLNVILPPANSVPSNYSQGPIQLSIDDEDYPVLPPANKGHRPDWLALDERRVPVPVDTEFCAWKFPCLVEARYAGESEDAVAADRYLFLQQGAKNMLYLHPGAYRLRTVDANNNTLNEQAIQAVKP
jgi:hypothetical protein